MTATHPDLFGLHWQQVNLKDLKTSIKAWCDERRNQYRNGYFILIQDQDGGGYEVIKQRTYAWPKLRKIALGYVSEYLKRKYGQDQVADNINVWIAAYDATVWSDLMKVQLENTLLGKWADLEAQDARCRKIAAAIKDKPEQQQVWRKFAPDAYAWLKTHNYL